MPNVLKNQLRWPLKTLEKENVFYFNGQDCTIVQMLQMRLDLFKTTIEIFLLKVEQNNKLVTHKTDPCAIITTQIILPKFRNGRS